MRGAFEKREFRLLSLFLVLIYIAGSNCSPLPYLETSNFVDKTGDAFFPKISPMESPQPFLPSLAPSPFTPFLNSTIPKLSGLCPLNFTAAETLMSITSTDCFALVAPYLANVVCCPQLQATVVILVGQSSKNSGMLALNTTLAKYCLSDINQSLVSRGATDNLQHICKIRPLNLTEGSCPVKDVNEFEKTVDTSKLLTACQKIDIVNECCTQTCQNAISDAAQKLTSKSDDLVNVPQLSIGVEDCRSIVLRWLASRLDTSSAKEVLRGLSNCHINKVCPLVFPDTRRLTKECGSGMKNQTACCNAMGSYVTHLQNQSFITNLQALNCAASLGKKLQHRNITKNVYDVCHVSLKDFSLQAAAAQVEAGCLLQSLPSDVTLDQSGITFLCDLNDNIPAPWPSAYQLPASSSSCNKTVKIPALPAAAASGQPGLDIKDSRRHLFFALCFVLLLLR